MTKKQKEEQRAAEIRKQALLASGVVIEGLQQQPTGGSGTSSKKFTYGSKKKRTPQTGTSTKESTPISTPLLRTKALTPEPEPSSPAPEEKPTDVKDGWDNESEEEKPEKTPASAADVKSDWDESSEDEKPAPESAAQPKGSPNLCQDRCDLTTFGQLHRNLHPRQRRPRRSRSLRRDHQNPSLKSLKKRTPMTIPTKIPTRASPRHSKWLLKKRPTQPRGEQMRTRLPLLLGIKMI